MQQVSRLPTSEDLPVKPGSFPSIKNRDLNGCERTLRFDRGQSVYANISRNFDQVEANPRNFRGAVAAELTSVVATLPLVHGHHVPVQLCESLGPLLRTGEPLSRRTSRRRWVGISLSD